MLDHMELTFWGCYKPLYCYTAASLLDLASFCTVGLSMPLYHGVECFYTINSNPRDATASLVLNSKILFSVVLWASLIL